MNFSISGVLKPISCGQTYALIFTSTEAGAPSPQPHGQVSTAYIWDLSEYL